MRGWIGKIGPHFRRVWRLVSEADTLAGLLGHVSLPWTAITCIAATGVTIMAGIFAAIPVPVAVPLGTLAGGALGCLIVWLGRRHERRRATPRGSTSTTAKPRVSTGVDPKQSNINCLGGGMSLFFSIFVTVENTLDVDVQLKAVELCARMKDDSSLDARTARFQGLDHEGLDANELEVSQVCIPKRSTVEGWFLISHDANIRIGDFVSFELRIQAVGEPAEVHRFEPYDWDDVKGGESTIVMVP